MVVKRLFCYFQLTKSHGLLITKSSNYDFNIYIVAYWAVILKIDFNIYMGNNLISWMSHNQPTITCSSTKVEYCLLALPPHKSLDDNNSYLTSLFSSQGFLSYGAIISVQHTYQQIPSSMFERNI